jgi:hypothetical protein
MIEGKEHRTIEELTMKDSDSDAMKDVPKSILSYLDEERAQVLKKWNFRVAKIDDSQLWLETLDEFISVKLLVRHQDKEIVYDARLHSFSLGYDVHLKEDMLHNAEKLDSIAGAIGEWKYQESVYELWFVVQWIKIWARRNGFVAKRGIVK